MAEPCDPLAQCKDLDGKLLLQRAVYGPQLAFDPGATAFGGVASAGSSLRAVLHLRLEVKWKASGLCMGPPTSIMGLAPGEVVTIGLRTRSTRTFSSLMRHATEKSKSSSRSDRETGPEGTTGSGMSGALLGGLARAVASAGGAAPAGNAWPANGLWAGSSLGQLAQAQRSLKEANHDAFDDAIELTPTFVGKFGSIFEDAAGAIGGAVTGAVTGVVGAVTGIAGAAGNAVADLVDNVIGGAGGAGVGSGLTGTVQRISEIIDTVERSESESSLRETTVTTTTDTEQTISRTFGNPYLDRSLQLRFLPVYQRFEVSTRLVSGLAGLATVLARPSESATSLPPGTRSAMLTANSIRATEPAFSTASVASTRVSQALAVAGDAGAESHLRSAMLSSVQKATQASGGAKSVRLDQGLSWDRTSAVGNAVHVPLASADIVSRAWGLKGQVTERLKDALSRLRPEALDRLVPPAAVKVVHVFAGLHVEAVPGSCVLPDIPEHLRVIVPGATTYAAVRPSAPTPDN